MHDPVSPKPKKIRKNQPHARLIDVGFRTYVRYEVGELNAPVNVLIKMAGWREDIIRPTTTLSP